MIRMATLLIFLFGGPIWANAQSQNHQALFAEALGVGRYYSVGYEFGLQRNFWAYVFTVQGSTFKDYNSIFEEVQATQLRPGFGILWGDHQLKGEFNLGVDISNKNRGVLIGNFKWGVSAFTGLRVHLRGRFWLRTYIAVASMVLVDGDWWPWPASGSIGVMYTLSNK